MSKTLFRHSERPSYNPGAVGKSALHGGIHSVILWWLANIVLIAVVAPVCLLFLNRVLRPIFEIRRYVDDVLDHGVKLTGTLDCVPNLIRSCELTGAARLNVTRYGLALARLLPQ